MNLDINSLLPRAVDLGLKILGAIAIWIIGRWLVGLVLRVVRGMFERQKLDATLGNYLASTLSVILNIALVLAILEYFGVQTTSLAALIAGAGVAIGAAWGGLLSNFAAGVFMVVLRPFKTGDFVTAGGVAGTVREMGLFGTVLNTPDNVATTVGNAKIFGDTIQNFSANSYRRVDLVAQIHSSVDPADAIARLKAAVPKVSNVLKNPAPDVEILQFNDAGPLLAVRPYCHNDHYWQVYFDTNKVIHQTFAAAGYPAPEQQMVLRTAAGA